MFICVNNQHKTLTYVRDANVDGQVSNPSAVLKLNAGDTVDLDPSWNGNVKGGTDVMYSWFGVMLLYPA